MIETVFSAFLGLGGLYLIVWLFMHLLAEPGTQVKVFGVGSYTKKSRRAKKAQKQGTPAKSVVADVSLTDEEVLVLEAVVEEAAIMDLRKRMSKARLKHSINTLVKYGMISQVRGYGIGSLNPYKVEPNGLSWLADNVGLE